MVSAIGAYSRYSGDGENAYFDEDSPTHDLWRNYDKVNSPHTLNDWPLCRCQEVFDSKRKSLEKHKMRAIIAFPPNRNISAAALVAYQVLTVQ